MHNPTLEFIWRSWKTRFALATLDGGCQHCRQHADTWLCQDCQVRWVDPVLVHTWPMLDTRVYSLHPLAGQPKRRLYGAKFYHGDPWWPTALLAEGLTVLLTKKDQPVTLLTLPGRKKTHWMEQLADALAMDAGYIHQPLTWRRPTQPQHTRVTPMDRWINVENALMLPEQPNGRAFLLDDVTTTGASLYYAAQAVRQTGYNKPLIGLTLCYVPDPKLPSISTTP
jgi:predicted amidophosphoribosyltransferase